MFVTVRVGRQSCIHGVNFRDKRWLWTGAPVGAIARWWPSRGRCVLPEDDRSAIAERTEMRNLVMTELGRVLRERRHRQNR